MKCFKVQNSHIVIGLTFWLGILTLFSPNLAFGNEEAWSSVRANEHPFPLAIVGGESALVKFSVKKVPGEIILTNFPLLKELGLMPVDAPNILTDELKSHILNSFALEVLEPTSGSHQAPFATYYADGGIGFAGGKGDGRALWIAQLSSRHPDREGMKYDVSIKGSGTTGLGYSNLPGHSDGMSHVSDALQEFYVGEMFSRLGLSDASRILAVIKTGKKKRLAGGELVDSAIMVRVSPTNLRFAHIWRYGRNPEKLQLLLKYLFSQDRRFNGLSFREAVRKLLEINTQTTAREAAILENFNLAHLSPTRGNRLITGELIDFGTVLQTQVVDWHYYKSIWLGSLIEQKKHLLYWNQRLKETLESLIGPIDSNPEDQFEEVFLREQQRLNLYRLGFSDEEIQFLFSKNSKLVSELSRALDTIKKARTRQKIGKKGFRYRRTIFDHRRFVSKIPYDQYGSTVWSSYFSIENLVRNFGTQFKSRSFKSAPVVKALRIIEDQLTEAIDLIAKNTSSTPQEILDKLAQECSKRNQRTLPPSPRSREKRMNEWAVAVRSGMVGEDLLKTIDEQLNGVVDFEVAPSKSLRTIDPGELYLGYLDDLSSITEINEENTVIDIPEALLDSTLYKEKLSKYGGSLSIESLNGLISELYYMVEESQFASVIRMGLEVARLKPKAAMKIIFELIQMFPGEFELDPKDALNGIGEDETIFSSLPVVKVIRHETQPSLLIRIKKNNSYIGAEAIDEITNEVVFRDGIRKLYSSPNSIGTNVTSSYLESFTDPGYRNRGLYRMAIEQYRNLIPDLKIIYLNSENRATLELLFLVKRVVGNPSSLVELLQFPFVKDFLAHFSVDFEKLLEGEEEEKNKFVNGFIKLSLQGRVRLKAGLSFDLDDTRFATFKSRVLETLEAKRTVRAIDRFEVELAKSISGGESDFWRTVFPEDYLDQIKKKSNHRYKSKRSCVNLFLWAN